MHPPSPSLVGIKIRLPRRDLTVTEGNNSDLKDKYASLEVSKQSIVALFSRMGQE